MSGRIEASICVAHDHPALPGHFPGQPVVPGVVLLDRVIEAAEASLGRSVRVVGMPQVKFLSPLLPGQEANAVIEVSEPVTRDVTHEAVALGERGSRSRETAGATLRFRIERAGAVIAQGTMSLAAEAVAS